MLTGEHSAVDLSSVLKEGVLGLAQAVIRLAGKGHLLCSTLSSIIFVMFSCGIVDVSKIAFFYSDDPYLIAVYSRQHCLRYAL